MEDGGWKMENRRRGSGVRRVRGGFVAWQFQNIADSLRYRQTGMTPGKEFIPEASHRASSSGINGYCHHFIGG